MSSRILTCLASCCRGAVAQCCASQLLTSLGSQGCPYSAKGEACALGALCQAIRRLIVRLQSSALDLG